MDTGTIRRVRWVVAALALTVAGAFLAWAILFGINLHARFQAQSLVSAVRSMQVGSTTLDETRPLLERYRASTVPASFTGQYLADTGFYSVVTSWICPFLWASEQVTTKSESFIVDFLWDRDIGLHGIGVKNERTLQILPKGVLRNAVIAEAMKSIPSIVRNIPSQNPWGCIQCRLVSESPYVVICPPETTRVFERDPSFLVHYFWNEGVQRLQVKNQKTGQEEPEGEVRTKVISKASLLIEAIAHDEHLRRAYGSVNCWMTYIPPHSIECPNRYEHDIHDPDAEGPLMGAVRRGEFEVVRELLAKGANANTKDQSGTSVLMASTTGDVRIVEALLSAGADPNLHAEGGVTALMLSIGGGNPSIVRDLLRARAEIDAKDEDGMTALFFAVIADKVDLARVLIDAGADPNAKSPNGRTPLMEAADYGALESSKLLIQAGADVNAKDKRGSTALSISVTSLDMRPEIIGVLKQAGAKE